MKRFDFDNVPDRRGTDCYKYDEEPGLLPLWVADMDFAIAPCIQNALRKRLEHPVFGYNIVSDPWREAIRGFFSRRYQWEMDPTCLRFITGVVPALSSSVRALSSVGDNVVICPPVYNIFYNSIRNNGRVIKEVPLLLNNGVYELDFDGLEEAFSKEKTTLCLFCNPGNPSSRIWSKEELSRLAELAKKHHVTILSDEIHGPVTRPGKLYVPFLTVSETAKEVGFAAFSPTKAFNIAGLQTAAIYCENPELMKKIERQINTDEVAEPNNFALVAATYAYEEGEGWLEEMLEYVYSNRDFATSTLRQALPDIKVIEGDATYLLWVDASAKVKSSEHFVSYLKKEEKLFLNAGIAYGQGGEGYVRINLATSRKILEEALTRFIRGYMNYQGE